MRQLSAIMFTDLVGFTALMQEDEARARAAVGRHRDVLRRVISEYGGDTLQFYGDGTLSVFPSAITAVESAVAIQREARGDPPLPMRIGIHTGDVVLDEDEVYGDGVNLAARIQGLGVPGSVLVSAKVMDEIKNHPRIRTRALGAFDLKNVKQPLEILAVVGEGLTVPGPEDLPTDAESNRRSIAVLPFVNMSSDPENEFFSDGVTEEVINVLTRIDGLKVTARTSTFAFKGRNEDVREIGRQLGVSTVLEGSVRRASGRVRVAAQLIETRTGYHLYSEVFDRALEDIFQVQDDLARAIAKELEVHLAPRRTEPAVDPLPSDSCDCEAYTEHLRGLHHFNQWTPEAAHKAIAAFDRALALDERWAAPLAMKAGALVFLGAIGHLPAAAVYPLAETACSRAIELDPESGEAHTILGLVKLFYHWDFEGAYASFQRALTLSPGSAQTHQLYSFYLRAIGALDESIQELEIAHGFDPLSLPIMADLASGYALVGRHEDALRLSRDALDLDPSFRTAREGVGWALYGMGRLEEALQALEALTELTGDPYKAAGIRGLFYAQAGKTSQAREMLSLLERRQREHPELSLHVDFAAVHVGLGETDLAVHHLEQAAEDRQAVVLYLGIWPHWEPVRGHPRIQALMRRIRGDRIPTGSRS